MVKYPGIVLIMLSVIIACNKNTMPVITSCTTEPPLSTKQVVEVKPNVETGKVIFINHCGNCHGLPKPDDFSAKRWDGILSYMDPKARLITEQIIHVAAYLKVNGGK